MTDRETEVIKRLCAMSSEVMRKQFNCEYAADCICPDKPKHSLISFDYSEQVLDFIETAVREKIAKG